MTLTDLAIIVAVAAGSYYVYQKSQTSQTSQNSTAPEPIPVPPLRQPTVPSRPAYQGALFPISQGIRAWKQDW